MIQQSFELKTWGGRRRGAGRPPQSGDGRRGHAAREGFRGVQPVHVTVRMADFVWNLRSQRSFRVIDAAIRGVRGRPDFRVVLHSILGNHIHLMGEASGNTGLADGMRALGIRVAKGLNTMMGRRGRVFADRYHVHVLRTPAEVRNAIRYVMGNFARHAAEWGERRSEVCVDRFSSAAPEGPRRAQLVLFREPATSEPRTWLLRRALAAEGTAESEIRPPLAAA